MDHFISGCIGGGAGIVVGHPFDTVKVRIQTDPVRYKGPLHCLRVIAREESMLGLYKGLMSPLYGFALGNAVIFGIHGYTLRFFSKPDSLLAHSGAGAVAGVVQSVVASPVDLAKIRMQNQGRGQAYHVFGHPPGEVYRGPIDCLRKIYRTEGLCHGVFRGMLLTCIREGGSFAAYFPVFHAVCRYFTPSKKEDDYSIHTMLLGGGLAGMACWLVTYPADVVKTRYQDDPQHFYRNTRHAFIETYRSGGYKIFFQGLSATMLRAFPCNAATLTVAELVMRLFRSHKD